MHFNKKRVRSQGNSSTNLDEIQTKIPQDENNLVPDLQFESSFFKTTPCHNQHLQNQRKVCPFYHDESDRRRDPTKFTYKCIECPDSENCKMGDQCDFAHNKVEQVYHPNRYKTKFCTTKNSECEYGKYCSFAHYENELKLPSKLHTMATNKVSFWMHHYKTVWCPYTQGHDRANCVYAHNPQDFRRDPETIQPIECPNWNKKKSVQNYEEGGCQDMQNCPLCHGWKELEYHPKIYKTKQCTALNCNKSIKECAFYHNENDRRIKRQLADSTWVIDEAVETKKIPFKTKISSNFCGPIIPNKNQQQQQIQQQPQDLQLNFQKMEIGQPLELFSIKTNTNKSKSNTNTKESDSRKNSIESNGLLYRNHNNQYHINSNNNNNNNRQYKQQQFYQKKGGSAPTTPHQNQKDIPKINPFPEGIKYSRKFLELIQKQSEGQAIMQILQGLKLSENYLMSLDKAQLGLKTNLMENQLSQLYDVVQDVRMDQNDSELLRQAMQTNQQF